MSNLSGQRFQTQNDPQTCEPESRKAISTDSSSPGHQFHSPSLRNTFGARPFSSLRRALVVLQQRSAAGLRRRQLLVIRLTVLKVFVCGAFAVLVLVSAWRFYWHSDSARIAAQAIHNG